MSVWAAWPRWSRAVRPLCVLAREGYPIRVYIPYGTEWYPYLTRRLAERPANLWFFASNLLRSAK